MAVAEYYQRSKGFPFIDYLSAPEAAKVFEDAEADPHGDLEGSLFDPDGFAYWAAWHESCGSMIRVRVRPVAKEHVPADELARLLGKASSVG